MSLLDKASLIVTPNAYKASKLYSVVPNTTLGDMNVVRATTATRVNSLGLIESLAINVPRIDYTNGSCPSLLVESQRTNLLTQSNNFSDVGWEKTFVTATLSSTDFLNGEKSYLVSETALAGNHNIAKITNVSVGVTNTYSIYFKKGTGSSAPNIVRLRGFWGDALVNFNILTGTKLFQSASVISASITPASNGWFRCTMTYSGLSNSNNYFIVQFVNNTDSTAVNLSYVGNVNANVFVAGGQNEVGLNATSYIPTVASTVTRNADVISKTGISTLIGQTEGTIYAEIKVNKLIGTSSRYILHISDGTVNNRIYMAFSGASSNVIRARIFNSGTLQCSINSSTITTTGTYKLALAYKNNDIVFYINGVQIGTDVVATIPTCSKVDIGHNYASVSQLNDGIANANIFKTRLSNTELVKLTTL